MEVELGGSGSAHDGVEDTELSGGKGTNHDATCGQTHSAQVVETSLGSDSSKTGEGAAFTTGALLVDLGEECVGGVRDNGSNNTGNNTGLE